MLWFVYLLIVCAFVACIPATAAAGRHVPAGLQGAVLTASFMGYALALLQNSIWLRRSWALTLKGCFDGLIYAALTAGTFGWLWPH